MLRTAVYSSVPDTILSGNEDYARPLSLGSLVLRPLSVLLPCTFPWLKHAAVHARGSLACQTFQRGRKVWEPAYSVLVLGIWNYFASRKRNANFYVVMFKARVRVGFGRCLFHQLWML